MRRAQARHPYAVTQSLENKFRDAQAALAAAAIGPGTEEIIKQLASISARLTAVQAAAIARWGTSWLAESLADFNATFGVSTVSPIMEGDEEDEDNVSTASTDIFPGMEVEPTPEAGGNAAPGSAAAS